MTDRKTKTLIGIDEGLFLKGEKTMEERKISTGASCLLVRDKSLLDGYAAPLYKWLEKEGFISWEKKGCYYDVDWVYINIYSKVYAPGIPGVPLTPVLGKHAITLDEFMTIYQIYKKYEGLSVMIMSAAEQKEWYERQAASMERHRLYWADMTFEKYCAEIESSLIKTCPGMSKDEALGYMEENMLWLKEMFRAQESPDQAAYYITF